MALPRLPELDLTLVSSTTNIVATLQQQEANARFVKAKKIWAQSTELISEEAYQADLPRV